MDIFSRIATRPQNASLKNAAGVLLGQNGSAEYYIENAVFASSLGTQAADRVREHLSSLLDTKKQGSKTLVRLELSEKVPEGVKFPDQAYSITAGDDKIILTGYGERGILYAAVTLCQLLRSENGRVFLPALSILDYPDIEERGHFIESRYGTNTMTFTDWKSIVDDMVEKKQNALTISVYGCWSIQYDGLVSEYIYYPFSRYPKLKTPVITRYYSPLDGKWIDNVKLPPMFEENFFGKLCAYGRSKGVKVVPFINTYGHNTLIPAQYPETSAKFPDGTPTGNGFCTSNPKTYETLFAMFDDIIDNCLVPNGITSIDIGLDEVGDDDYTIGVNAATPFKVLPAFCHCPECEKGGKRPIDKFIAHAVKLIKYLKSRGMTEVYMYSDMLYRRKRPPEENYLGIFFDAMRENGLLDTVVLGFWSYPDCESSLAFTKEDLRGLPVRVMLKPMNGYYHWNIVRQSVRNSYLHAQLAQDNLPFAYSSYSGCDRSFDRTNSLQATLSWNLYGSGDIAQITKTYCERLFPTQSEIAVRGFDLLDRMNEAKDTGELSTRTLMENYLAYYFYSYLRRGTEYPQNFPGRAVLNILSRQTEAEALMEQVLDDACEAENIFDALSLDPACDRKTAKRLCVESSHYRCLVEDYVAILRMYDLTQEGLCGDSVAEIRRLAAERIEARLRLMARVQEEKEEYLFSSQLRNMSIFLQFFRDLVCYLDATPANEVRLDFTDLRPIASKQFMALR